MANESGARKRRHHRTALLHRTPRQMEGMRSDINVTPLVDVVLVLLIIFMVVTPMLSRGLDVPLPLTKFHGQSQDTGEQLIVSLSREGAVYFERERVSLQALQSRAEDAMRRKPGQPIFVKGDRGLRYGQVREVMEALHAAGASGVQLATHEDKGR